MFTSFRSAVAPRTLNTRCSHCIGRHRRRDFRFSGFRSLTNHPRYSTRTWRLTLTSPSTACGWLAKTSPARASPRDCVVSGAARMNRLSIDGSNATNRARCSTGRSQGKAQTSWSEDAGRSMRALLHDSGAMQRPTCAVCQVGRFAFYQSLIDNRCPGRNAGSPGAHRVARVVGRRGMMLEWKERDSHRSARILCHVAPRRCAGAESTSFIRESSSNWRVWAMAARHREP